MKKHEKMTAPLMQTWIEQTLRRAFSPTFLDIWDESVLHAHHSEGGQSTGTHFRVHIESDLFEGKSRLAIHRLVNDQLAPAFEGLEGLPSLHALALTASWSQGHKEKIY